LPGGKQSFPTRVPKRSLGTRGVVLSMTFGEPSVTRCFAILLVALVPLGARAADAFTLKDGDRVVLIGSTLIEREQRYGYWETALTQRYPGVTFRNLGWSGDTVFGIAQASFGSVADGFKHLKEHVAAVKPTVLLIGYGTNESFEGEAGLPRFQDGL